MKPRTIALSQLATLIASTYFLNRGFNLSYMQTAGIFFMGWALLPIVQKVQS